MGTVAYTYYIFLMALTLHAVNANYCRQRDCGIQHTLCKFPGHATSEKCKQVEFIGLTSKEIGVVLKMHNMFRKRVATGAEHRGSPGPQPAARNLMPLRWDNEVAFIAQRWAIQCKVSNDVCRHVDRFHVGQNIAYSETIGPPDNWIPPRMVHVEDLVHQWYSEVMLFNKNEVDRVTKLDKSVKNYILMMSDRIKFVGCGAIRYKHGQKHKMFLVCNYGPADTFLGKPLYQRL